MANNMVRARIQICGTRPLLQHQFGPGALPLEKEERSGVPGNDPAEWRRTSMVTADGQMYVRGFNAFGMLRDAARHTKKGKGSLQSQVAATLQILDHQILLDRWLPEHGDPTTNSTDSVYIDVAGVKNPSTKGRNVRYRLAASSGWKAAFTILWDKTIISRDQMRAILNDAAVLVGLGDGRSIGYGRFAVEAFEVLDAEKAAAA